MIVASTMKLKEWQYMHVLSISVAALAATRLACGVDFQTWGAVFRGLGLVFSVQSSGLDMGCQDLWVGAVNPKLAQSYPPLRVREAPVGA